MGITLFALFIVISITAYAAPVVESVNEPNTEGTNSFYVGDRAPLVPIPFLALPIRDLKPGGWLRRSLELQRDGLTGHLGEISIWLTKKNNAWLSKDGKGDYGWEEVPYWLRGYARIAYILDDPKMLAEAKVWIDGTLNSQRDDGDFGPIHIHSKGFRDLWAQMLMLQVLQSYYDYSHDPRVPPFMTKYFQWEMTIPDNHFLKDYWENSRGGDNLASVYWLYNLTGDKFLLDLATKIDRNTANWRQYGALPNWHGVNIAECFREPATYYLQSGKESDMEATRRDFQLVRDEYGQVPGGMFGADENAREGYTDPRQATETCTFVEQMASDGMLLRWTGDNIWAENAEDVAFNSLPAALTEDYRALRYLTAPNMVMSDDRDHAPGIQNSGPFLLMNPFSSRCCQHNSSSAWVNYAESAWMATPDNGLAAQLYTEGEVTAKVGGGTEVTLVSHTRYPFEDQVAITVKTPRRVEFPLYLRIPSWAEGASVKVNGRDAGADAKLGTHADTAPNRRDIGLLTPHPGPLPVEGRGWSHAGAEAKPGEYLKIAGDWKDGDTVLLRLPMAVHVRRWEKNKNSVSVDYGPLTFSLKIEEQYFKKDSSKTAIGDSRWQPGADASQWPSYEILPKSDWNYGLILDAQDPARSFAVVRKKWPADDYPFTVDGAPIEIKARGRLIPSWMIDQYGLCGTLPESPVKTDQPAADITLIPMGGARLRISAFPVVGPNN